MHEWVGGGVKGENPQAHSQLSAELQGRLNPTTPETMTRAKTKSRRLNLRSRPGTLRISNPLIRITAT